VKSLASDCHVFFGTNIDTAVRHLTVLVSEAEQVQEIVASFDSGKLSVYRTSSQVIEMIEDIPKHSSSGQMDPIA
jgi:hypothetical protein